MEKKLSASVKSVLQLVAEQGLNGNAEIRCRIEGQEIDAKATLRIGTHSDRGSYHTYIHHLEIDFDDAYIERLVKRRVDSIFANLVADACKKPTTTEG